MKTHVTLRLYVWSMVAVLVAVGVGGVWARDRWGTPRPCAQCKRSVRTPVGVEVPLHKGCKARYADAQIENRVFEFTATREQVMATKTQVVDGGITGQVAGTIAVWNQFYSPGGISAATKKVFVYCGVLGFIIEDISTSGWTGPDPQPSAPGGTLYTFAVYIEGIPNSMAGQQPMAHEFVYVSDADDDDFSRAFSVRVGARRIWRTESTRYGSGRDGKPVFVDDVDYADEFIQDGQPWSWEATFGSLSWSGTQTWDAGLGEYIPSQTAIESLIINFQQHKGQDWLKYASAENLQWSAVNVNFAGMSKTYGTAPPGSPGTKVTGGSGSLILTSADHAATGYTSQWLHGLPLIPDFRDFGVWERDGNLLGDLRIAGPWVCSDEVPDSRNWSTTP